jgi:hypothetical protein
MRWVGASDSAKGLGMNPRRISKTAASIVAVIIFILPGLSHAGHPLEMYPLPDEMYSKKWCSDHGGVTGVRMPDGTSADCITTTHVMEVQFAPRWAEAMGWALYYSSESGKRAGIVLIIKENKDLEYWKQLNSTIQHFKLPIDTWKIE